MLPIYAQTEFTNSETYYETMETKDVYSLTFLLMSFVFVTYFSLYYLPYLFRFRKYETQTPKLPPGRTGLPFIGETLNFISYGKKGVPERFILDRVKKYSSTVIRTSLLGEPMALLCGPEANKMIFSNHDKLVTLWSPSTVTRLFGSPNDRIPFSEMATNLRNHLLPYLSVDALKRYVPVMDSETKQHLKSYWEGRDTVTVHALTKIYTLSLASKLILGIEDEETLARIHKSFGQLVEGLFALPLNIPGLSFNRALKAKGALQKDLDGWIEKCKMKLKEGMPSDTRSVLADILKDFPEQDDIAAQLLSVIAAAYDSTSDTLTAITMFLGQFPHVYDKVLTEQREVARSKAAGEMLNWQDIQKMKYSWNVACEVLRLYPPRGLFREVVADFTYAGFLIPKGWKIHFSALSTHKNQTYFEDPEKFDPSRFEGNGPEPYTYCPFGGGPRMCAGREYARIKILVFMHNLVTKFRWEQIYPRERILVDKMAFPVHGLPVRLYPQES